MVVLLSYKQNCAWLVMINLTSWCGAMRLESVGKIIKLLEENYPRAETSLRYRNSYEFLVAVILSARSTDEQVNRITGLLFQRFPGFAELARAEVEEVSSYIKGCGLHKNKSISLVKMARVIEEKHGGRIPSSWKEVLALPGAGRKTASLVMGTLWGEPALPVDTHVYRVSKRLGLASGEKVEEVEEELKEVVEKDKWLPTHHRLIEHGRFICVPRKPACERCFLIDYCGRYFK